MQHKCIICSEREKEMERNELSPTGRITAGRGLIAGEAGEFEEEESSGRW